MGVALRTGIALLLACVACGEVLGLGGNEPASTPPSPNEDAGVDGASPETPDAASADAQPPLPGFCASSNVLFCDDFDRKELLGGWGAAEVTGQGYDLELSTSFSLSPPSSLRAQVGPSVVGTAGLRKDFTTKNAFALTWSMKQMTLTDLGDVAVTIIRLRLADGKSLSVGHDRGVWLLMVDEQKEKSVEFQMPAGSPKLILEGPFGGSGAGKTTLSYEQDNVKIRLATLDEAFVSGAQQGLSLFVGAECTRAGTTGAIFIDNVTLTLP